MITTAATTRSWFGGREHGVRVAPVTDKVVAKECSACHMLYPAGLLPARSWTAVMAGSTTISATTPR